MSITWKNILLSARVLRLSEYFSTDNVSFCVSASKVGSYTGNLNDKKYPHRSSLSYSSHSSLLPTANYVWYNTFFILVNFEIFLICLKWLFIVLLFVWFIWMYNFSVCLGYQSGCMSYKNRIWDVYKSYGQMVLRNPELYTSRLQLKSVDFWQCDFRVEGTLSLNLGFTIWVFLLRVPFDCCKESRHHNVFVLFVLYRLSFLFK